MKILIIYRHFWPDSPPYASLLRSIGKHLVKHGHEVTIWCEQPCYKASDCLQTAPKAEILNGIMVERFARLPFSGRVSVMATLDKLMFLPRLLGKALRRKMSGENYELVWTATIPPVFQGFVGRLIARLFRARFLYHFQDVYPELGQVMGLWPKDGLVDRILTRIEIDNRQLADQIVTLSGDMLETILRLSPSGVRGQAAIINNFLLDDFATQRSDVDPIIASSIATTSQTMDHEPIDIIFAGNLGIFQGLDKLVEAMQLIQDNADNIHLTFMGDGKAKQQLQSMAKDLQHVYFRPHRPFAEAQYEIARADVGIVSLEPKIYQLAYPSKTLTYMGLGLPIFAIVEPESQLAQTIVNSRVGFIANHCVDSIADALLTISNQQSQLLAMRKRAKDYYRSNLSSSHQLSLWAQMIRNLENDRNV